MAVRGFFQPFPVDPSDFPGIVAGGRYPISLTPAGTAVAVNTASRYFCAPWMPDFTGPITTIGIAVTAGGTVASSMKVALTAANLTTMRPTGLALGSNNTGVSTTGTGNIDASIGSVTVQRGQLYFVVSVHTWDTTAPTVIVQAGASAQAAIQLGAGLGSAPAQFVQGVRFDGTFTNDIAAIDFGAQTYVTLSGGVMPLYQVGVA